MMHSAATVLPSPPRFSVAGWASASVRLRLAKDRLRSGDMPRATQRGG